MVRSGQNHRHRIAARKKTSASHRNQKLTIAEVYLTYKDQIFTYIYLHDNSNFEKTANAKKRGGKRKEQGRWTEKFHPHV